MFAKVSHYLSRFVTWVRSIGRRQEAQPTPHQYVKQRVPEWMDDEQVDPIDESVWESFPASDPPALSLEDRS